MKKILVALLVAMLLICGAALAEGIAPTDAPTAKPTATPAPTENTDSDDADVDVDPNVCLHVFDFDWVVSQELPSCTEDGTTVVMCSKCKKATTTYTTQKLNHNWDYTENYNKAGDANNHYYDRICLRCGLKETKPEAHNWKNLSDTNVVDPTCTKDGYRYVKCDICYKEDTITVEKLGHDPILTDVVEPTCFAAGYELWQCNRCGGAEKKAIAQLKHDYTDWVIAQNPSCTQDGLMYRYCLRDCCSNTVLGKQYKETKVIKAPGHKYDADRLEIVEYKGKKYITGYCIVCHEFAYKPYSGQLPSAGTTGTTGGGNAENSTANKPTTNNAGVTIPATGETTSIAPIMMVLAIAGLAVLAATKQKVNG